jgi:hypothetical protein
MSSVIASASHQSRTENTPAQLRRLIVINWIIAAIVCAVTMISYGEHRHAVQTVGRDAAPSVVLAHKIKNAVLNQDADIVNYLIAKPGENNASIEDFRKRSSELAADLISAAENITYGDAERIPIRTLELELTNYATTIQSAIDQHDRRDAAYLVSYRKAYEILQNKLLPAADALNQANATVLAETYARESSRSNYTLVAVVISGLALIAWIVYTQRYLSRKFNLRLSGMLLTAGVLAAGFTAWTSVAFMWESSDLVKAKEWSYDSVVALMDARASAYDANAAESRWLLDPTMRTQHEQMFVKRAGELVTLKANSDFASAERQAQNKETIKAFTGSLATELNNITFTGEREAATATLHWFGVYIAIDKQIRALELSGHHAEAIALCIGNESGQSNWAFNNFDGALGDTLKINQDKLDEYVAAGFADINMLWGFSLAQALLQALLFLLALRPRIKEYLL